MTKKRILNASFIFLNFFLVNVASAAAGDPWDGATSYDEWICKVWGWLATVILPVSTLVLIMAGYLWMTSEGNPEKIGKAKEYIIGVASGIGLLIISYFLINNVLGINVTTGACIWT